MKNRILIILFKLYAINNKFVRKQIERIVVRIDGGYYWSITLRKIYRTYHNIVIGIGSYGCFDINRFPEGTVIGNYCSIAAGTRYLNANHPVEAVTTHPVFCNADLGVVKENKIKRHNLKIGNDVWIGYGATILCSCNEIENGVIVGAGAVVTKDLDAYYIYGGIPAKKIKKRFSDDTIKKLEDSRWYEKELSQLLPFVEQMNSPEDFLKAIREK